MTRIITMAEMETLAWQIADHYVIKEKHGDASYTTHCPVHGGDCLRVSPKSQLLVHCFGVHDGPPCSQDAIRAKIKEAGFDLDVICMDAEGKGKGGNKSPIRQNTIAHDQTPYEWQGKNLAIKHKDGTYEHHPITACYTYTTADGKIVFYQLRADIPTLNKQGKKGKLLKVYSSFHNTKDGTDTWDHALTMPNNRPLYNLKELTDNPTKPVLVVEGEKACEAAKLLFPNHVCTAYSLGVKAWSGTDWKPLKGRDVTLWPDNSQAAIDEFLKLAEVLEPSPKMIMFEPFGDRPANWDVADELPNGAFDHDTLLERAETVEKQRTAVLEDEGEVINKYNDKLRVLWLAGSTYVYDKSKITPNDTWLPYRYMTFGDLPRYYPEKIITMGKGKQSIKEIYAVDIWKDSASKIITQGITYDPSTDEELVLDKYGSYETNKFLGWGYKAAPCDPSRYECFLNHIEHVMDGISSKFMINFIAHMVQKPKEKPGVLPILIGLTGTGKTIIGYLIQAMLGERNVLIIDGGTFISKWSGQFSGKIAICVDEFTTRGMSMDFMNTLLTDKRVTLEHKGKNLASELSYHRAIGTTNDGAFILSSDDRRLFPIEIVNPSIDVHNKSNPVNEAYFRPLKDLFIDEEGLAGLLHYFINYQLDMNIMVPPNTNYRKLRMVQPNPVHAIICEMCETGNLPTEFGKTVLGHIGDGRLPGYPERVYRHDMLEMLKRMYPKNTESKNNIGAEFMKFIAPEDKNAFMNQPYRRDGSTVTEGARAARYYELPAIEELRARYNKIVDPNMRWSAVGPTVPDAERTKPPHLRIVNKDSPDDGSPI